MRTTQLPIQWVPGALSLGVRRPERESEQSPPSNAEIKTTLDVYRYGSYSIQRAGALFFPFTLLFIEASCGSNVQRWSVSTRRSQPTAPFYVISPLGYTQISLYNRDPALVEEVVNLFTS